MATLPPPKLMRSAALYISAGANNHPQAADWGDQGVVAFGSDRNVCLWYPQDPAGVTQILRGHHAHVRAVRFIPRLSYANITHLVTAGEEGSVFWWCLDIERRRLIGWEEFKGIHTSPVNCIAVLKKPTVSHYRRIFVTGAADATIQVWRVGAGDSAMPEVFQKINTTGRYFPMAAALSPVGRRGHLVLAVAGTSNVVQIFTADGSTKRAPYFTLQATLSGHETWVRSLDFVLEKPDGTVSDLLLASASQDKYIRLWRIHPGKHASTGKADGMEAAGALVPSNKTYRFDVEVSEYCVLFEALLLGHEDWIYSGRWSRSWDGTLRLLSASADNSLAIWELDEQSGIWVAVSRLGEVSREKGATTATGSVGGFWTGLWSPDGDSIITFSRTGSWRRWDYDGAEGKWEQKPAISGHTRAVTGISWSPDGAYLLSTSLDRTTRLHAEWVQSPGLRSWHEMARPQIHGYDLNCVDWINPTTFVSGAEEKLMRVFREPRAIASMLHRLTDSGDLSDAGSLPDAANMPVLGLSNKAIDVVDDDGDAAMLDPTDPHMSDGNGVTLDPAGAVRRSALEIDHPPFEESLSRHTLWPEIEKLYGHGYEISCLATSHDGRFVASACHASSPNHAVVRLFETAKWTEVRPPLAAHSLTVTRLRFSPDDRYLLSVGRDRLWAVYERRDSDDGCCYTLLQTFKGHSRQIFDAAWAPTGNLFATAARESLIRIWTRRDGQDKFSFALTIPQLHKEEENEKKEKETPEATKALDFWPDITPGGGLVLATGSERGKLAVLYLKLDDAGTVTVEGVTAPETEQDTLHKEIMQLAWRPARDGEKTLALAGGDGSVRIYTILD
ncbi:Elongator complex protein 2 [Echria macrotheca]|uniref:Elongator complex protein 2 n=1 Tax=Echria macrotheca TaxID=438768 RepID=A0AAJ0BLH1_9PEZI|nr:Elongator complex protein 2 [Echria macrotheca]